MSEGKIIKSVAVGIVLGCISTYFFLMVLDKFGITFAKVNDQWGIFLSLLVTVWIAVSTRNYNGIKALKTAIDENTKADRKLGEEIKNQLNDHNLRLTLVERELGIKDKKD